MSDDVYRPDPNRIVLHSATNDVQAWKPDGDDIGVCMYHSARVRQGNTQSWTNFTQYMTAAEARDLAVVLTQAADHVEALTVVELEDA